jgi:hypothetical protein
MPFQWHVDGKILIVAHSNANGVFGHANNEANFMVQKVD